jgi:hypothetical protein
MRLTRVCLIKMYKIFLRLVGACFWSVLLLPTLHSQVVINEIFYNAPEDLDDLEYIELWNSGDREVDVEGWELSDGVLLSITRGNKLAPGGFFVACKDAELFERIYKRKPDAEFKKSLNDGGERITLRNRAGDLVETVYYQDEYPWPLSADGGSASLERITPTTTADDPYNWAPSQLSKAYISSPSGTPGLINTNYKVHLPPVIKNVQLGPNIVNGGDQFRVVARVLGGPKMVELLYSIVSPGLVEDEISIEMQHENEGVYSGEIPGQKANRIIRYRVRAMGVGGGVRLAPHPNELRPAFSTYVLSKKDVGLIPVVQFIGVSQEAFQGLETYRDQHFRSRGRGGFGVSRPSVEGQGERLRHEIQGKIQGDELKSLWAQICLGKSPTTSVIASLVSSFQTANSAIRSLGLEVQRTRDIQAFSNQLDTRLSTIYLALQRQCAGLIDASEMDILYDLSQKKAASQPTERARAPGDIVRIFFNVEDSWFRSVVMQKVQTEQVDRLVEIHRKAFSLRETILEKVRSEGSTLDLRSALDAAREGRAEMDEQTLALLGSKSTVDSETQQADDRRSREFRGGREFGRSGVNQSVPPQGESALIYRMPGSSKIQFFDYVNILPRKSGYKVRFHKDRPLNGLTTMNVLYEPGDASTINEAMAYPLYLMAGNATVDSGLIRVLMNGKLAGYHLWFEQPNGNFFKRHDIDHNGNLYKVNWQGSNQPSTFTPQTLIPSRMDIASRYEKITNPHKGYSDLVRLIESLEKASSDDAAMWVTIEENFEIDQVINYYAVNLLLSHWDGFFNNYFLYHDTNGSGKWSLYPWDQDSTWSLRGGTPEELSRMPLDYGAEGARPPGAEARDDSQDRGRRERFGFGGFGRGRGFGWWRDGDAISRPILANPTFREKLLARLESLTVEVFNIKEFAPKISSLLKALEPEMRLRSETHGLDVDSEIQRLREVISTLREHLAKRRSFILSQLR